MRFLEALIPISLGVYLLWRHPRPVSIRFVPAAILIINLLHFLIEGYRWQMVPLYAMSSLVAVASLVKITQDKDWKPLTSSLTAAVVVIATSIPILLPIPKIPSPSGPYPVGTRTYELIDDSRPELYSGRGEPRRFMIQAWYPATPDAYGEQAPWMAHANQFAPAIARYLDLPTFFLDHLSLVKIPAIQDAGTAATDGGFPLILFSHGWNGFNAQNSGQALELASHGFVVIGVQHTYGAVMTVFPDGSVAPNNSNALLENSADPAYESVARILADQWAGDLAYTLEYLGNMNSEAGSPFERRLQMDRVGVYGHSTGGGAAIEFCGRDKRCTAVLGMDPFLRPVSVEVLEHGISQPSLFLFSQGWVDDFGSRNNQLVRRFLPRLANNFGVLAISGTRHYDFSDLPLLSPIAAQLGLKGPIEGRRVTEIVNTYLLDFFALTLNRISTDLFDGPSARPPEVFPYVQNP